MSDLNDDGRVRAASCSCWGLLQDGFVAWHGLCDAEHIGCRRQKRKLGFLGGGRNKYCNSGKTPPLESCTDRLNFAPRPPEIQCWGVYACTPPLNGKNIATQHWTSGGGGPATMCSIHVLLHGWLSVQSSDVAIFIPPTDWATRVVTILAWEF